MPVSKGGGGSDLRAGMKRAMTLIPTGQQTFVTKHVTGMCGVCKFLKLWGYEGADISPRCGCNDMRIFVKCPVAD
jgi:hypothetical protein